MIHVSSHPIVCDGMFATLQDQSSVLFAFQLTSASFSGYAVVMVPSLPIVSDRMIAAVEEADGIVIFGPRSGSKTPNFSVHCSNFCPTLGSRSRGMATIFYVNRSNHCQTLQIRGCSTGYLRKMNRIIGYVKFKDHSSVALFRSCSCRLAVLSWSNRLKTLDFAFPQSCLVKKPRQEAS